MSSTKAISGQASGAGLLAQDVIAPPHHATPSAADPRLLKRAAMASFIGNFVEWFDYASYGYLATIIAVVFFPKSDPRDGPSRRLRRVRDLVHRRPIGGIVWGHFGDKIGRRTALSLSILIMSCSTSRSRSCRPTRKSASSRRSCCCSCGWSRAFPHRANMRARRLSSPNTRPRASAASTRASCPPAPRRGCCSARSSSR